MQKPLSNPFRPAASRNLKPSSQTDEFAWSAVSETNFHHALEKYTFEGRTVKIGRREGKQNAM